MSDDPDTSLQADAAPDLEAAEPSYYRLDEAAWAQIAEQYRAGATAKTLAALWRVSAGSIYRHACAGGWTKAKRSAEVSVVMVARERERLAHAEQIAGEREAAAAPREADPLVAAQVLLRRGAGSALKGRGEQAKGEIGLARALLQGVRLLAQAKGGTPTAAAAEDDEDVEPPGWRDSAEAVQLRTTIMRGLKRLRKAQGRTPPQELPAFCWLPDYPQYRALAEALGVVDADDNAVCDDFEAAVEAARAAGRGALVDAALTTPLPRDLCPWMDEEPESPMVGGAGEAEEAEAAPVPAAEPSPDPPPAEPPRPLGLGEPRLPWAHLLPIRPEGLAPRRHYIGGP